MTITSDTTEHRIGQYILERRIGTGGMAEVWKARVAGETQLHRAVAVKMVLPRLIKQPGFVDLFVEEARITAQLQHSNIVQVHDLGRTGDTYYLVLEYVSGTNLAKLLAAVRPRYQKLPTKIAVLIAIDMCRALEHAHTRRKVVVHGDVSPTNVLISYDAEVKLTDFGVAQVLGSSGAPIGGKTPYMSPEQIRGHTLTVHSDIFSMGLMLYELLAERFFRGETPAEIGAQVVGYTDCPPERLELLPPAFRSVVARALDPNPDRRFRSAADFETAVENAASEYTEVDARSALASLMRQQFREGYAVDYSSGDATQSENEVAPPKSRARTAEVEIPEELQEELRDSLEEETQTSAPATALPSADGLAIENTESDTVTSDTVTSAAVAPVTPSAEPDAEPTNVQKGVPIGRIEPRPPLPDLDAPPPIPPPPPEPPRKPPTPDAKGIIRTGTPGAFRFETLEGEPIDTIIGIDLGTTYSCAATVRDGQPAIIPNELGRRTFSSAVYIHGDHVLVGELALDHIATHPSNVVHSWKRLLGRDFNSPAVQDALDYFAYDVEHGPSGEATVQIGDITYRTPWLAARVLYEVRVWAREELGGVVSAAVITVPAYYTGRQRDAVREAAKLAGFDHVRLLAEPVAAAIAQGVRDKAKPMLVYDFGGGTFDVTVLNSDGEVYEVVATGGDPYLGGVDFDDRIIKHLVVGFYEETGVNIVKDPAAMARLRAAAETAKRELSEAESTQVSLPFLAMKGKDALSLSTELTRAKLEELSEELVRRSLVACDEVLGISGLRHGDIGEILMIGGMTRMPKIRERVQEHFKRRPRYGFADEAVALGAARFAGSLGKAATFTVVDVVALSVGVNEGGRFVPVISARNALPAEKSYTVKSTKRGQTETKLDLYQGNAVNLSGCEYLGTIRLSDLKPAEFQGQPIAEVKFMLDEEGILRLRYNNKQLLLRAQPHVTKADPARKERKGFWSKLLGR